MSHGVLVVFHVGLVANRPSSKSQGVGELLHLLLTANAILCGTSIGTCDGSDSKPRSTMTLAYIRTQSRLYSDLGIRPRLAKFHVTFGTRHSRIHGKWSLHGFFAP